ncbi:SepM family pheromone-processing serine protease [Paenibacillus sp. S150]|uniref:SepM family pheromone-processing serine protease n=1 Tax=Paenibacillus sp. S150 TaxID=2749826 RepID=UPI001C596FE4|nr:SepM family pheromone-processing serine protease [Paenibacillus sp. S150]MBW4080862.1 PDZ domain-containing protein [Paenibacillus sp. S150]
MRQLKRRVGFRATAYLFTFVVILYVAVFMNTPYIVYQPGSASEVAPMIQVRNADADEKGAFMMTTVSASYANVALLIASVFNSNAEIVLKETRLGDKTEQEYAAEQVYYMNSSQSYAVQAAYRAADIPYEDVVDYLYVFSVPVTGNQNKFKPGDKIISVEGQTIPDPEALSALLAASRIGDQVAVVLERGGKEVREDVKLVEVKNQESGTVKPGLGVVIGAVQKVKPEAEGNTVSFVDTDVGGPSAGLMFTMEIVNQLTPGDLTKGSRVAGTGTIDADGNVGAIGGVKHKIVAADRKGAEIFFVPVKNYEEAKSKADKIGTDMQLVPVSTLAEALKYMQELPVKP